MSQEMDFSQPGEDSVERLGRQLGLLDLRQVAIWREMGPAGRLGLAFQMYQFALHIVRSTERQRYPDLSTEELNWRVIRRMHGDPALGTDRGLGYDD